MRYFLSILSERRTTQFILSLLLLAVALPALAQTRVAVLPFKNMNGKMSMNEQCYSLADSTASMLASNIDNIVVVPADSVENVLAELNLDPTNPQYESDMWKAVEMLNVGKVVTGTFNSRYKKIFINVYVYDVADKLPDQKHQARNLWKPLDKAMETIPTIVKKISPAFAGT